MKHNFWLVLSLLLFASTVFAEDTCSLTDHTLVSLMEQCNHAGAGTLCYGSNAVSVEVDGENIDFDSDGTVIPLLDVIGLEGDSNDALALVHLNREDVSLRMIAYGEFRITNTAPRRSITVYTLRGVNIRQTPSLEARILTSLAQGRDYTAVARLEDSTWLLIRLENGVTGWASAQYFISQDGFAELEIVNPATRAYLPMQSLNLHSDCGGLLLLAPGIEDETIIFGVNGAQIQVTGIVSVQATDGVLSVLSIDGDQLVNAFGFEMALTNGEMTTIPLSEAGSIAGIPSDSEDFEGTIIPDNLLEVLISQGE